MSNWLGCITFCAKGHNFSSQNCIQFKVYNNDVKFAHNLLQSRHIPKKYSIALQLHCILGFFKDIYNVSKDSFGFYKGPKDSLGFLGFLTVVKSVR